MTALNARRARLRHELHHAHDVWMTASEWLSPRSTQAPIDTTGASETTQGQWHAYLAAKERLVRAWAEDSQRN